MSEQNWGKSKQKSIFVFLLALIFFGYCLLGWGILESRLLFTNFLVVGGYFIGILVWRGFFAKAKMPRLGIEIVLLIGLLVGTSSLWRDYDPLTIKRLSYFLAYVLLFYFLIDIFERRDQNQPVYLALVVVVGILILTAIAETYMKYLAWWQDTNSFWQIPPESFRFMSLLGYSGVFMGLINLIAPFTVVLFQKSRVVFWRVVLIYWWITYVLVIFASSSRGGFIGGFLWILVMVLLWIVDKGGFEFIKRFWQAKSTTIKAGITFIVVSILLIVINLFVQMSSHSSHAGLLSGRQYFWRVALELWKQHPWLGIGPGKYAFEYFRFASIPPQYLPPYAHSLPIQMLVDFGLIGFIVFLLLIFYSARKLLGNWWNAHGDQRLCIGASIAGIAAFAAQNLIDDFSFIPAAMFPFVAVLAIGWSGKSDSIPRWPKLRFLWVSLIPVLWIISFLGWSHWSYLPLRQALKAASNDQWENAAILSELSAKRAPNNAFFQTEAGLAFSRLWEVTGEGMALDAARSFFRRSAEIEPNYPVVHANLAILDWNAGNQELAIQEMEKAVELAHLEPLFVANLGNLYEQMGQENLAMNAYQKTLKLAPAWASHPFWNSSALRQIVIKDANIKSEKMFQLDSPLMTAAWQAFVEGDWQTAKLNIELDNWSKQVNPQALFLRGVIAEQQGDFDIAREAYEQMATEFSDKRYIVSYSLIWVYNISMHQREGFTFNLVPGFLQLDANLGQYEALGRIVDWHLAEGDGGKAEEIQRILDALLREDV